MQALLVFAANPAASVPDQNKVRRGLAREDLFTVVIDNFQTDTADYADLLLPATMQTEHADLHSLRPPLRRLERAGGGAAGRLPVAHRDFPPPGAAVGSPSRASTTATRMARQVLASPAIRGSGGSRSSGFGATAGPACTIPTPFVPFAEGFPTESGRLEFFSQRLTATGQDPVAGYTPPYEAAQHDTELARRYPLALIAPASHYFLNTMFANVADAKRQASPADVFHPADADRRGPRRGRRRSGWQMTAARSRARPW